MYYMLCRTTNLSTFSNKEKDLPSFYLLVSHEHPLVLQKHNYICILFSEESKKIQGMVGLFVTHCIFYLERKET